MPWPRRKLVTILDSGTILGGTGPGGGDILPVLEGLGVWYKADKGPYLSVSSYHVGTSAEYFEIANNPSVQLGNIPWTIGGWVWVDSLPTVASVFLGKRDSINPNSSNYQIFILASGTLNVNVSNGTTVTTAATGVMSLGAWHFVTAFYDPVAATLSVQLNNGAAAVTTGAVIPEATVSPVRLGGTNNPTDAFYFSGRMQNWFIFGRLLSAAERVFLWNGGAGRPYEDLTASFKTDLRAWWPLDELSGTRRDVSGNSNTLADINTVAYSLGHVRNPPLNGRGVYFWDDSGPNDFDLGTVSGSTVPVWIANARNGQPVVRFDGADDYMQTASILGSMLCGSQAQSVFVVQKQLSTDSQSTTYSWNSAVVTNVLNAHLAYLDNVLYYDTGSASPATGRVTAAKPEPWGDTWHIIEMVRDAANGFYVIEGNPLTSTMTPTGTFNGAVSAPLAVGTFVANPAALAFQGDIAELIMYSRTLTATERTSVREYLKTKWGIAQNKRKLEDSSGYRVLEGTNDRLALE